MIDFQESHRHKISVTADDFGVSPRSNRNTLYLISLGKIDRVGIMVNGEISSKEIDELSRSGVKLDIHLDILHKFNKERTDRHKAIPRVLEFIYKFVSGKISKHKVHQQWQNQIEKFHTIFGKYPDGINSHEHIHFFPPFFSVACSLKEKYKIPYIRFGDSPVSNHHNIISYILHMLRIIDQKICTADRCVSSNFLVSLDWIQDVNAFLNSLPDGITEVACHPEIAEDFVKVKEYF